MSRLVALGNICLDNVKQDLSALHQAYSMLFLKTFIRFVSERCNCYYASYVTELDDLEKVRQWVQAKGISGKWILCNNEKDTDIEGASTFLAMAPLPEGAAQRSHVFYANTTAKLFARMGYVDLLYFSASNLAVMDEWSIQQWLTVLTRLKINGGTVCFFANYEPQEWKNSEEAQKRIQLFEPLVDIIYYDLVDYAALASGCYSLDECLMHLRYAGVKEMIIRQDNVLHVATNRTPDVIQLSILPSTEIKAQENEMNFAHYVAAKCSKTNIGNSLGNIGPHNVVM